MRETVGSKGALVELISRRDVLDKIRRQLRIIHSRMPYVLEYDDLFQEVMFRCIHRREQFRGEKEQDLLAWCRKIGWSILIDELRQMRRRSQHLREIAVEQANRVQEAEPQALRRELLVRIFRDLSTRERKLLELSYFGGVRLEKIGSILGISRNAAKQLHYRTLKKIRGVLMTRRVEEDHA